MPSIGEGAGARLSALAVVLVLCGLVGAAIAGRPAPPQPVPTLALVAPAVAQATPPPTLTAAAAPAQTPAPKGHRKIAGDDGIFGSPGYPWRGSKLAQDPVHFFFNYRSRAPGGIVTR